MQETLYGEKEILSVYVQMSSGCLLTLETPLHPSTLELEVHPCEILEAIHAGVVWVWDRDYFLLGMI